MAEQFGQQLKDQQLAFGRVYLSPLLRAWMTYKIAQPNARATTVTSLLVEEKPGKPDYYKDLIESPDPAIFPGDEDDAWFVDGRTRAKRLLAKLLSEKTNVLLCFGHWAIFNYMLQIFLGYEADVYRRRVVMRNCGISKLVIEPDGTRIIEYWNNHYIE